MLLMMTADMEQWKIDFNRGRSLLSRHESKNAFHVFSQALKLCPSCECGCSSNILYLMGIALKQLGYFSPAIKLWISANRIKKQRRIKRMIERYANGYGMLRQASPDLDDRNAFFSIQIARYLEKKADRKFSTHAEQDVVFELVNDYWKNLIKHAILKDKTIEEKRTIFHKVMIPFPYIIMPKCIGDSILNVNFMNTENSASPTRCFCGSGLSFSMCCGRTPSVQELINGNF
jgi:tetratricopeptide (TPR) repeat protein